MDLGMFDSHHNAMHGVTTAITECCSQVIEPVVLTLPTSTSSASCWGFAGLLVAIGVVVLLGHLFGGTGGLEGLVGAGDYWGPGLGGGVGIATVTTSRLVATVAASGVQASVVSGARDTSTSLIELLHLPAEYSVFHSRYHGREVNALYQQLKVLEQTDEVVGVYNALNNLANATLHHNATPGLQHVPLGNVMKSYWAHYIYGGHGFSPMECMAYVMKLRGL
jgi:hypothetical protein